MKRVEPRLLTPYYPIPTAPDCFVCVTLCEATCYSLRYGFAKGGASLIATGAIAMVEPLNTCRAFRTRAYTRRFTYWQSGQTIQIVKERWVRQTQKKN